MGACSWMPNILLTARVKSHAFSVVTIEVPPLTKLASSITILFPDSHRPAEPRP